MRIAFAAFFVLVVGFGAREFSRWRQPEYGALLDRARRARRITIFAALVIVAGMALGGTFLPTRHVGPRGVLAEFAYWMVCLLTAVVIPFAALREFRATLRAQSLRDGSAQREAALNDAIVAVAEAERRAELPHRNGRG